MAELRGSRRRVVFQDAEETSDSTQLASEESAAGSEQKSGDEKEQTTLRKSHVPASMDEVPCAVCKQQLSRYTCPRCLARYCTAACYKQHGVRCTEEFYKEQVVDEIQSQPVASEEQRRGMLEILKRMQAENEEAESAGESEQGKCPTELLGTALENVELDENTNWADLSEEAKKAFMKAVHDGLLDGTIVPWEPWWTTDNAVMEERTYRDSGMPAGADAGPSDGMIDGEEEEVGGGFGMGSGIPPIPEDVPPLSSLTSKQPSPLLPYTVAAILWCYALCQRRWNGDAVEDEEACEEAARELLVAAGPLLTPPKPGEAPCVPASIGEAVQGCVERLVAHGGLGQREQIIDSQMLQALGSDLECLLKLKSHMLRALADSHRLLDQHLPSNGKQAGKATRATLAVRPGQNPRGKEERAGGKRRGSGGAREKAAKKVWFLLCWANEQGADVVEALRLHAAEWCAPMRASHSAQQQQQQQQQDQERGPVASAAGAQTRQQAAPSVADLRTEAAPKQPLIVELA